MTGDDLREALKWFLVVAGQLPSGAASSPSGKPAGLARKSRMSLGSHSSVVHVRFHMIDPE